MRNLKRILSILTPLILAFAVIIPLTKATPAAAQVVCEDPYFVARGETLGEIAEKCDVTVRRLTRLNPQIDEPGDLEAGMRLDIPGNGAYTVRRGDTLSEIAVRYDTTVTRLLTRNPGISDPDIIHTGQTLNVPVLGQGPGSDIYIVERGDTLSEIASMFNVTLESVLQSNPEIVNPNLIITGQVIDLPENASPEPSYPAYLTISPLSGVPGTTVTVRGYDFAPNTELEIGPGVFGAEAVYLNTITTDAAGNFTTSQVIPAQDASPGESWVILALNPDSGTSIHSPLFRVVEPDPQSNTYVVRPGDTLYEIAQMFGTTVERLLELNPQIENPNLIYTGWLLTIE